MGEKDFSELSEAMQKAIHESVGCKGKWRKVKIQMPDDPKPDNSKLTINDICDHTYIEEIKPNPSRN